MKPLRWTSHALRNLADREISRQDADRTLAQPEVVLPDLPGRRVLMRRYYDQVLRQEMLPQVVVEETADEIVVVTVYKTSQIGRYLRGWANEGDIRSGDGYADHHAARRAHSRE